MLALHRDEQGLIAQLRGRTPVVPLAEATVPVSVLGEIDRIARQATDDRAQHVLEPLRVIADGLLELLERTPQVSSDSL